MKVKIKKEGKVKEFKLINSWDDVNLETWTKLLEYSKKTNTDEAIETITTLSNIPKDLIKELSLYNVVLMMNKISELQAVKDNALKRIIEINGVEYGFHPDLDLITLGEYADIESFIKFGIYKRLPELMAILYRPIKEKKNDKYIIEPYDGDIRMRTEEMKQMKALQVQSAMVFFYRFVKVFLPIMQSCLQEQLKEMKKQ
tara:strand:- start:754 stop:1353 length:600 start_codon:yes stop_codon:yes gene_type:complete